MREDRPTRPTHVVGPLGERLTLETLPPRDTRRWVARRKAEIVAAVDGGLVTADEACAIYGLTCEELRGWQRAVACAGMPALRVTSLRQYRLQYQTSPK